MNKKYAELIGNVRKSKPLIHHITNYVTVHDCANITLAVGASPIMADAQEEAADIASISSAVVLNMGTLNVRTIPPMIAAGKAANAAGTPVIFDPVGAGASKLRNDASDAILKEVKVNVLRGNISEIRFIAGLAAQTKGVDASESDMENTDDAKLIAKGLAERLNCVVAITGKDDIISDGKNIIRIANGNAMLSCLTGTGCMCSSLVGSFCGANPDTLLEAAAAALLTMSIAGEIAFERAGARGNGSFHTELHNAVSKMDAEIMLGRAKLYEE